jgi:hypothetical protein
VAKWCGVQKWAKAPWDKTVDETILRVDRALFKQQTGMPLLPCYFLQLKINYRYTTIIFTTRKKLKKLEKVETC